MALQLRIGNFVEFPVALKARDGDKDKTFKLRLTGKRLSSEQWRAQFEGEDNSTKTAVELAEQLLLNNITGWSEQTLVVDDETGQPAEFSREGLQLVLGMFQALSVIQGEYITALGIKDGSTAKDARAKN